MSPLLTKYLLEHDTGSCGTVRAGRKFYPQFNKGQPKSMQMKKSGDMLAISWHDRRQVRMLSTVSEGKMKETGKKDRVTNENQKKPDAVIDYNVNMRLMDKSDMQVGAIECVRRSVKWYKKMFLHLIDIVVLNAYNLWLVKTGDRVSLRIFQKRVITQMLAKYGSQQATVARRTLGGQPDRLLGKEYISRHYLEYLPQGQSGRKIQQRCHVCAFSVKRPVKRKDVQTQCHGCKVPLCIPCFQEYHTKRQY